jgi:hypothetical protein
LASVLFEITVNGRDFSILPKDKHVNAYLDPNSINYYEALFNRDGFVVFEVNTCYGDVNLGISQNYSGFLDEIYDDDISLEESTHSYLVFPVK